MKLHEIKGLKKVKKIRVGRGDSARRGNFCGSGMNGQNCRSGGGVRPGFSGGSIPLSRKIPKLKGFKNPTRVNFVVFNLNKINEVYSDGEIVSLDTLYEKSLLKNKNADVKILGRGELTKKITFSDVIYFSATAKSKIESLGLEITS